MSIVLPKELQRRAEHAGVSIEEYLLDMLTKDYDFKTAVGKYLNAVAELLEQAEEELKKGDLRQAGEKTWGACALAFKAHALAKKSRRIESHAELWIYKDEVARELGVSESIILGITTIELASFTPDTNTGKLRKIEALLF